MCRSLFVPPPLCGPGDRIGHCVPDILYKATNVAHTWVTKGCMLGCVALFICSVAHKETLATFPRKEEGIVSPVVGFILISSSYHYIISICSFVCLFACVFVTKSLSRTPQIFHTRYYQSEFPSAIVWK